MKNKILILIAILTTIVGGYFVIAFFRKRKKLATWSKIVNPGIIRKDSGGDGNFQTSRTNEKGVHQGVDLSVTVGQPIYAPFDGLIVRKAIPYANDNRYSGLLLSGDFGQEVKIFYINALKIGERVNRGELIGTAQNISAKYTSNVTNHIHIEYRQDGILTDPTKLLTA